MFIILVMVNRMSFFKWGFSEEGVINLLIMSNRGSWMFLNAYLLILSYALVSPGLLSFSEC